ncbi:MAG: DNA polymerase IV [Sphingomonadaceae bacterium]|nr:DNA polymerase IV [Sphingomonadaceae bacterium]
MAEGDRPRKIIHVDMDAFFASVEQRDNPALRGKPVAVGGSSRRGVVAAASYEARKFGVRSAMPSVTAARLCPTLIFARPRFEVYRAVSHQIRAIFAEAADAVQPLSLDEAYLDVSDDKLGLGSATATAKWLRARILAETALTASAGVATNKLIAKLASDENKPDGLTIVPPGQEAAFVQRLSVRRLHGVGPATAARLEAIGIASVAQLAQCDEAVLRSEFRGGTVEWLRAMAQGIDNRPVDARRVRKSVGAERTFEWDLLGEDALLGALANIVDILWERARVVADAPPRTVTLKLKFADFQLMTRSSSADGPVASHAQLVAIAERILRREMPLAQGVRLMGVSLSGYAEPENLPLFADLDA